MTNSAAVKAFKKYNDQNQVMTVREFYAVIGALGVSVTRPGGRADWVARLGDIRATGGSPLAAVVGFLRQFGKPRLSEQKQAELDAALAQLDAMDRAA